MAIYSKKRKARRPREKPKQEMDNKPEQLLRIYSSTIFAFSRGCFDSLELDTVDWQQSENEKIVVKNGFCELWKKSQTSRGFNNF